MVQCIINTETSCLNTDHNDNHISSLTHTPSYSSSSSSLLSGSRSRSSRSRHQNKKNIPNRQSRIANEEKKSLSSAKSEGTYRSGQTNSERSTRRLNASEKLKSSKSKNSSMANRPNRLRSKKDNFATSRKSASSPSRIESLRSNRSKSMRDLLSSEKKESIEHKKSSDGRYQGRSSRRTYASMSSSSSRLGLSRTNSNRSGDMKNVAHQESRTHKRQERLHRPSGLEERIKKRSNNRSSFSESSSSLPLDSLEKCSSKHNSVCTTSTSSITDDDDPFLDSMVMMPHPLIHDDIEEDESPEEAKVEVCDKEIEETNCMATESKDLVQTKKSFDDEEAQESKSTEEALSTALVSIAKTKSEKQVVSSAVFFDSSAANAKLARLKKERLTLESSFKKLYKEERAHLEHYYSNNSSQCSLEQEGNETQHNGTSMQDIDPSNGRSHPSNIPIGYGKLKLIPSAEICEKSEDNVPYNNNWLTTPYKEDTDGQIRAELVSLKKQLSQLQINRAISEFQLRSQVTDLMRIQRQQRQRQQKEKQERIQNSPLYSKFLELQTSLTKLQELESIAREDLQCYKVGMEKSIEQLIETREELEQYKEMNRSLTRRNDDLECTVRKLSTELDSITGVTVTSDIHEANIQPQGKDQTRNISQTDKALDVENEKIQPSVSDSTSAPSQAVLLQSAAERTLKARGPFQCDPPRRGWLRRTVKSSQSDLIEEESTIEWDTKTYTASDTNTPDLEEKMRLVQEENDSLKSALLKLQSLYEPESLTRNNGKEDSEGVFVLQTITNNS